MTRRQIPEDACCANCQKCALDDTEAGLYSRRQPTAERRPRCHSLTNCGG